MERSALRSVGGARVCADQMKMLTIEECQRIDSPLREELELLDYELRTIITRILADIEQSGLDDILFLKATTTVLLSIAAGLLDRAAAEEQTVFDLDSFVQGAVMAAKWAKLRKLRHFVGGEA